MFACILTPLFVYLCNLCNNIFLLLLLFVKQQNNSVFKAYSYSVTKKTKLSLLCILKAKDKRVKLKSIRICKIE